MSPSFWWEIGARSDLASNMYLACIFLLAYDRFSQRTLSSPAVSGVIVGLLSLTRGVIIVPFILYFYRPLLVSPKATVLFVLSAVGVCLLVLSSFFVFWDASTILKYNPLTLQTTKTPFAIQVAGLVLCLLLATRVTTLRDTVWYSVIVLFFIVGSTFFITVWHNGWDATINETLFDVSYFNIMMPFLIFSIGLTPSADTLYNEERLGGVSND
jgi:hypothetical protein